MTNAARVTFVCFRCEHEAHEYFDACPSCGLRQSAIPAEERDRDAPTAPRLGDLNPPPVVRIPTGLPDWDEATGGGFVRGFRYLIFGKPGTRKSRDLLRIAALAQLAGNHAEFVSAEMGYELLCWTANAVGALDAPGLVVEPAGELPAWPTFTASARRSDITILDSLSTIEKKNPIGRMQHVHALAPNAVKIYVVQMDKEHTHYAGPAALEHEVDCSIILHEGHMMTRKNRQGPAPHRTKRTTPPHRT